MSVVSVFPLDAFCVRLHGSIDLPDSVTGVFSRWVFQSVAPGLGNLSSCVARTAQRRRHVIPFDPQSVSQRSQRNRLASAVSAWQSLPLPARRAWRTLAEWSSITGYQLFVSHHMRGLV